MEDQWENSHIAKVLEHGDQIDSNGSEQFGVTQLGFGKILIKFNFYEIEFENAMWPEILEVECIGYIKNDSFLIETIKWPEELAIH